MASGIDNILNERRITLFLGIENQSQYFGARLMASLFPIRSDIKEANTIIVPVKGLCEGCAVSNKPIEFFGQKYRCVFTKSDHYNSFAFIFSTIKSSDVDLIEETLEPFVESSKCNQVVLCDIGILKKREFVRLFNNVNRYLETTNIAVCLASIIGYNTRGASDIETGKEQVTVTSEFYKTRDLDESECVESKDLIFRQVQSLFKRSDIAFLCSRTKNSVESKLKEVKAEALKTNIKMLCDLGLIDKGLGTRLANETDINPIFEFLKKIGLTDLQAFNIVTPEWKEDYTKGFRKIRESKAYEEKEKQISDLINKVKDDFNRMNNYIEEI